jgi:hypothetical protein
MVALEEFVPIDWREDHVEEKIHRIYTASLDQPFNAVPDLIAIKFASSKLWSTPPCRLLLTTVSHYHTKVNEKTHPLNSPIQ